MGNEEIKSPHKIESDTGPTTHGRRRGSTGGLKYEGGEWLSSSDECDSSSSEENGEDETSSGECSTSPIKQDHVSIVEDVTDRLEAQVDTLVRLWCSKQQNLISMIQSIPDIYQNNNIPRDLYDVNYSS